MELTVSQALSILKQYHVTDSIQYLRKLIRDGKISAREPEKRKDGYRISEEDLMDFIYTTRPEIKEYITRIAELERLVSELTQENRELKTMLDTQPTQSAPVDRYSSRKALIDHYLAEGWTIDVQDDDNQELSPHEIDEFVSLHRNRDIRRETSAFVTKNGLRVVVLDNKYRGEKIVEVRLKPERELTKAQVEAILEAESKKVTLEGQPFLKAAKDKLMSKLLPNGATHTSLFDEKYQRYLCFYTGSRFKHPEKLVAKALHIAIDNAQRDVKQAEIQAVRDQEDYDYERRYMERERTEEIQLKYVELIDLKEQGGGYLERAKRIQLKAVSDLLSERGIEMSDEEIEQVRLVREKNTQLMLYRDVDSNKILGRRNDLMVTFGSENNMTLRMRGFMKASEEILAKRGIEI